MLVTGLIDLDEAAVLSRVDPAAIATAHRNGLRSLKGLILLHAAFQTQWFTKPFEPLDDTSLVQEGEPLVDA
jgi:hypothetical protein